jgi:pyruvate/2-oxoglutarate dehydrogenase complex dihydrolipoamide acyltransferase (E2) component
VPLLAGIGMFILTFFLNGFSQLIPCVGWLPKFILGTWTFGAVILTRFGTRVFPEEPDVNAVVSIPEDFPTSETERMIPKTEKVNATDAALELAKAEGIDLSAITGSGTDGRIILNDVRKAVKDRE